MVGACPPPRVNISTGKVYSQSLLSQAFVLRLFSVLQLYQLEDYSLFLFYLGVCTTYPQGGWARYISSGRMSSRTTSCSSTTLVLVTIHPQGGWARYISSGRMSSRTIRCSSTTIYHSWCLLTWCLYHISSGRMGSLHILREDELQNN